MPELDVRHILRPVVDSFNRPGGFDARGLLNELAAALVYDEGRPHGRETERIRFALAEILCATDCAQLAIAPTED